MQSRRQHVQRPIHEPDHPTQKPEGNDHRAGKPTALQESTVVGFPARCIFIHLLRLVRQRLPLWFENHGCR